MDFKVEKAPFLSAVLDLQSVVPKKTSANVYFNLLLAWGEGKLSLTASDMSISLTYRLTAETSGTGRAALPARHLAELVRELADLPVEFRRKDAQWMELRSGKSKITLAMPSHEDFPAPPVFPEKAMVEASRDMLRDMLGRTAFAISLDTTRPHMNGVCLESLEQGIHRMVGTDGHRLSFVDREVFRGNLSLKKPVILPGKAVAELRKLLDGCSDTVTLSVEHGYLFFRHEGTEFVARLIDAVFPDYRAILPKSNPLSVVAVREDLARALRTVNTMTEEKGRAIRLQLKPGELTLQASSPKMGEAMDELEVEFTGTPMEIGFNSRYLLDCLDSMTSEKIEISLADRASPAIVREQGSASHTCFVSPMRV